MAVLICWSTSTICQLPTTTDATLIPNVKLRDAAKLIEKGKICEERIVLLQEKINFLNQRIAIKDSIINLHGEKDSAQAYIEKTYQKELVNLVNQRDIAVAEMRHQNKLLKRQKRKTVFAVVGTAAAAAGVYFLLLK